MEIQDGTQIGCGENFAHSECRWENLTESLREDLEKSLSRVEQLEKFIKNGIEFGYIQKPDKELNDPALKIIESVFK